jgi:hypothetical protein
MALSFPCVRALAVRGAAMRRLDEAVAAPVS